MGRGDRPRLTPGRNTIAACACTVALMTWANTGSIHHATPVAPGPVAYTSR